jgi:hypothetical protein
MKQFIPFIALVLISVYVNAQEKIKTGYNIGGLPAVSYNSDEGFQYGAILNLFNYGDGSRFPAYNFSTYLEVSRYTKGSSLYRLYFDSDQLLKGIRTFIDLSYVQEDMLDFYGFNGLKSNFDVDVQSSNRAYYRMSQKQVRLIADFKGKLFIDNLNWIASYNFFHYTPGEVNFDKLNKGVDPSDSKYLDGTSLYGNYVKWGLISPEEADGGAVHSFKAGLFYDTRNVLINPSSGICTEALIEYAPGFFNEMPYTRYSLVHRQYQSIIKNKLNLAVRLGAQGKIGNNEVPFYRRNQLISPFTTRSNVTGLGGANSLRGIVRNRIVADGFAYGNFELRWRAADFKFINQNFYIGFNGFADLGIITDEVDWNLTNLTWPELLKNFSPDQEQAIHTSLGGGLKIGMNENFVISVDVGKALNERDASNTGIYININYLY